MQWHDLSHLYPHTHTQTQHIFKSTPHMSVDSWTSETHTHTHTHIGTHIALCSAFHLGTSIPLHSLIGSQWMDCSSSSSLSPQPSFFSSPFPSSSALFLSPHPPLSLFLAALEERKDVCGWVCEPSVSFVPFCSPLGSCFPSLSVFFSDSLRGELGAPLMYTEKEKGPF